MSEQNPKRRRIDSAHVISVAALFVALGSGAYAVSKIPPNSVGPQQIKQGAVGASELAKGAAGGGDIKDGSIKAEKLARGAATRDVIADGAIDERKIAKGAATRDVIADGAIDERKISAGAVKRDALAAGAVGPAALGDDVKTTLYTDVAEGPVNVAVSTPNTVVATLNLPAGTYMVTAGASAVHNSNATDTRLECSVVAPGPAVVDGSKERLQQNTGAQPVIFTKQAFAGPATLTSAGTITFECVSTNNTSIDLTGIRLMALRVTDIVSQ